MSIAFTMQPCQCSSLPLIMVIGCFQCRFIETFPKELRKKYTSWHLKFEWKINKNKVSMCIAHVPAAHLASLEELRSWNSNGTHVTSFPNSQISCRPTMNRYGSSSTFTQDREDLSSGSSVKRNVPQTGQQQHLGETIVISQFGSSSPPFRS